METSVSTDIRPGTYLIDPARSACRFTATHAFGLKPVDATMDVRGGTVTVAAEMTRSTASAELDAASFRTGDRRRDRDIRGRRFLDVANHPVISFRSTGCDGARVAGVLSVRGGACDVILEVVACEPVGDGYRLTATCVLDRVAAGVAAGRGVIARPVRITLELWMTR
jgi:polyisoprenoid-binding protein YceI